MGHDLDVRVVSNDRLFRDSLAGALGRRRGMRCRSSDRLDAADVVVLGLGGGDDRPWDVASAGRARFVVVGDIESLARFAARRDVTPAALITGEATLDELIEAVTCVGEGGTWCCERAGFALYEALGELGRRRRRAQLADVHRLSAREREVLTLIADGLENRTIADRLCISVHTVKKHVHAVLDKLEVGSREQAARVAFERRWVPERRRAR